VYGNVTLSRWDFKLVRPIDLSISGREERGALRTDIDLGRTVLHVFNVHLGTAFRERRKQAARIIDESLLKGIDISGPRVVLGDFNEWMRGLTTALLSEKLQSVDIGHFLPHRRTYPGVFPLLHLDHIYYTGKVEIVGVELPRTRLSLVASDHLPIVADIRIG